MGKYRKFTAEYREEAVRMVLDSSRPIAVVARDLGINEGTLGNWVSKHRAEHPVSEELTIDERAHPAERAGAGEPGAPHGTRFPKKSGGLLRERATVTEKFGFIAAEKADSSCPYPVVAMCRWLGVSTSGFYDHLAAEPSPRSIRRALIADYVQAAFDRGRGTYGVRRVHAILQRCPDERVRGVSLNLVRAIMAERGLAGCQPRAYRTTTQADPDAPTAPPDLVGRDFTAERPGDKLVGDITYIRTWTGWLYLATVIDCCTREVIGWSMATHMRADLVCDAITMAHDKNLINPEAIFHSDRGTQYTSHQFTTHLQNLDIKSSMGRRGQCWDNALAESFFAALKNELVYRTAFPTRKHARRAIAEYIEVFYNRVRIHSGIGYQTPTEAAHNHRQEPTKAA